MKKTLIALSMLAVTGVASAAEVSVGGVYDNNLDREGARIEVAVPEFKLGVVTPTISATHINDEYVRYAVGARANLFNVGALTVGAAAGGVYQNTQNGTDGYGATAGLLGSLPVTKSIDLTAGVEQFWGQDRVKQFDGTVASVGLNVRF
jgi:hypothetical protein